MNAEYFKHAVEELERHFKSAFGTKETRTRLLNNVWHSVKVFDDADLTVAAERLMMTVRMLPTPSDLQRAIEDTGKDRRIAQGDNLESDAALYRREAQRHDNVITEAPPSGMIADALKAHSIFVAGGCTRREYLQLQTALHKQYPGSGFDVAQSTLYERWAHKDLDGYCISAIYG